MQIAVTAFSTAYFPFCRRSKGSLKTNSLSCSAQSGLPMIDLNAPKPYRSTGRRSRVATRHQFCCALQHTLLCDVLFSSSHKAIIIITFLVYCTARLWRAAANVELQSNLCVLERQQTMRQITKNNGYQLVIHIADRE